MNIKMCKQELRRLFNRREDNVQIISVSAEQTKRAEESRKGEQLKKVVEMPALFSMKGLRILIVEDNEINGELVQSLLQIKGAEADYAENGKKAVEMFLENPAFYYSAVLMDIQMPEMDGIMATKIIRQSGKADCDTIPVIAITANSMQMQAKEAGMNDFLAKPFQIEDIYRLIYKHTNPETKEDYS